MEKDSKNKSVAKLESEIEANKRVIEKVLIAFKGNPVTINTYMYSSVSSMMCFKKLDWTYLVSLNEQHHVIITEEPFKSKIGTRLIFDIENIDEIEYINNILRIWLHDGFRLYIYITQ